MLPFRRCRIRGLIIAAAALVGHGVAFTAPPTWSPPRCTLASSSTAEVWFADVGEKVFQEDVAPVELCGDVLRLSAARKEHATFQIAVRANAAALTGVIPSITGGHGLGQLLDVKRAAFTNVTTAANTISSRGVGLYPDPLPNLSDPTAFPGGASVVEPGVTAVFWLTLGPMPIALPAGVHTLQLVVGGTGVNKQQVELKLWNFALPDAAHASQWTEADPFGAVIGCNMRDSPFREASNESHCPRDEPCLPTSVVDEYYVEMAKHRINRIAWMNTYDAMTGVGVTLANDTQSVALDTAAYDRRVEKLLALGYRDLKLPVPGCSNGASCSFASAGGVSPNTTWTFANSSHFNSSTGRGWYGNCGSSSGCVMGVSNHTEVTVPMFVNATLNAPSQTNRSLSAWQTQVVGDPVQLNPEFVRLFKLVMTPIVAHLRERGWINRSFAFISDETRWPCYSSTNFTVNAWVSVTKLYRSLDPNLKVQQDLTPQTDGPVWEAVAPLVDAWVWQEGQFQFGVASGTGAKTARIEQNLALVADARKRFGAAAYLYNNEVAVIDLPAARVRTFPWQLWRTNYAYPVSRHAGFQGSLSWYTLTGWFGSDPWKYGNVLCGKPLGHSAHPTNPSPNDPPCLAERAAGEWFELYPPADGDVCHKGPVTSVRWELLRQGLEDVEYLAMLDRLAGEADAKYDCGYEAAVLRGSRKAQVPPVSRCCASLGAAKAALDAVDEVTWGITASQTGPQAGNPPYNLTEAAPYSTNATVLHRVLDGVATAIEGVAAHCASS